VGRLDSRRSPYAGAALETGIDPVMAEHPGTPWASVVLGLLSSPASRQSVPHRTRCGSRTTADPDTFRHCTVKIEERLANAAFALSWSDPTQCSYREQVWKRAIARKSGVCALSGERIKRGDAVFRPQARRFKVPLNSGAMILAASLDTWDGRSVDAE
jgi:hypothetical protein